MEDKKHWYDGIFYDNFIAPNQDKIYNKIRKIIPENSIVLDFGCGTGRLSFQLADKCRTITAIDLSTKNIEVAKLKLKKNPYNNISFFHGDFSVLTNQNILEYDYSIISFVIHEIPENLRGKTLRDLKSVSQKIIISDYISPIPINLNGALTFAVEFLAGRDHFMNFKNYTKNGGIDYLAADSNLKIVRQIKDKNNTFHLAVLE
jgi:SAM-dependent methyltransferase